MNEKKYEDLGHDITEKVIGCAIEVHKELGPGLLESVYETCLATLMKEVGLSFERQRHLPIYFKGQPVGKDFRVDFMVENYLIVELKACDGLLPIHQAQLMTYMKLAQKPLGLLINFNDTLLKNGLKRLALSQKPLAASAPLRFHSNLSSLEQENV